MTTPQPVPVQTVEDREKERADFYGRSRSTRATRSAWST